jgi:hypothetical protein
MPRSDGQLLAASRRSSVGSRPVPAGRKVAPLPHSRIWVGVRPILQGLLVARPHLIHAAAVVSLESGAANSTGALSATLLD